MYQVGQSIKTLVCCIEGEPEWVEFWNERKKRNGKEDKTFGLSATKANLAELGKHNEKESLLVWDICIFELRFMVQLGAVYLQSWRAHRKMETGRQILLEGESMECP